MKGLGKLVAFCAVFLACGAFLLAHEFEVGALSLQGLRISGAALALVNGLAVTFGVIWLRESAGRVAGAQSPRSLHDSSVDAETRKNRMRAIQGLKAWIGALILGLVIGLTQIQEHPWWASAAGITINLLLTAGLARRVFRLQKTLK
jgi:uncharacterized membrane protein (DUF2068 family)